MTKETDTLMVLQNESFNYLRYPDNYIMDSWSYMDSSDQNKTKARLSTEDDLTSLTFFYDPCKTQKEQKMGCSRTGAYKPVERTPNGTPPELTTLETSAHIMKLLSDNISASHPHEVLDSSRKLAPHGQAKQAPSAPEGYVNPATGDSYDKQVINNIFDSLLNSKWPVENAFPEATTEALPYSTGFAGHASPEYSESYTTSPPERFRNDFQFILGAPQASQNKASEIPMVYLNKGQFYPITLQGVDSTAGLSCSKVKTVIMAVFDNDKSPEMQLKCWNHWHARQPTVKQRVIDIADYKEVYNCISNVEEVAFNALSFIWNTNEEAKVYIGINSLSTDFSSQKGVKGLPLNLQIDTYDFSSGTNRLIHRAACQIKVFCDKGAERKMRDEDRKKSKRRTKNVADSTNSSSNSKSLVSSSMGKDCTYFKTLEDHVTLPVLFIPEMHYSNLQRCGLASTTNAEETDRTALKRIGCYSEAADRCSPPPSKQARRDEQQKVLLYVRKETEEVFDALMLNTPTLRGLRGAISEKYSLQEDTIGKIFKKCKRGIFVNMDDNIVEHYSNHSAFLIDIAEVVANHFQVTLTEL